MFKLLIGVNGVGPKGALGILSGISADELRFAVLSDDVKTISKAPGIGKKTAQKMILELKDKLAKEQQSFAPDRGAAPLPLGTDKTGEAAAALSVLGYTSQDIGTALRGIDMSLPLEEIIRQALKKMVR